VRSKFVDEVYPKVQTGALFGDGLMEDKRAKKYLSLDNGESFNISEV
jgi:hypothetical protein